MTHKQAVQRMALWLRNTKRCGVVMAELTTMVSETPDVIGFHGHGNSILIECKVSRSDFLSDKQKVFRKIAEAGMGDLRYYAAPPGIITVDDIPISWGLIEIGDRCCFVAQEPQQQKSDKRNEVKMLMSSIRRLEISTAVFVRSEEGVDCG